MSLREVEPEVLLQLDGQDRSLESAPEWTYAADNQQAQNQQVTP